MPTTSLLPDVGIELREGNAQVGDVSLHYVEAGDGDAPLIVLLHGFPEFWFGWRLQIAPLAAAGFRVVAPDTRGYPAQRLAGGRDVTSGMARPTVSLLSLVEERRFSARNKRHRRKLLEDDSLLEFVAENPDAPILWRQLAEIQERYRSVHGVLDRSAASGAASSFEAHVRRVDLDGEPLTLIVI